MERKGQRSSAGVAPAKSKDDSWLADLDLVRSVLHQDALATEQFVQRMKCVPKMLTVMARRGGGFASPEEKIEIVQEVFTRVWGHLERFEGRSSLESWVYRYCALTLTEVRRNRSRVGLDGTAEGMVAPPTSGLASMDELRVQEAVAILDDEVAVIIELKHFEDLSFREIAERVGVSSNTAKTRYYRGLRELRDMLQKGFGGESDFVLHSKQRIPR